MAKFKTVITTVGAAKIAAVLAGTSSIVLDGNARMAIGDGNGTLPTPVPSQTALVHEVYRAALNNATIDDRDPKNIVAELVIPPETGGFWMREMALYDAAGTLLAVGNMAETYKPSLSEGAGRKQVIRMVIAVSDVSAVTITMDASTVMATKDYVDSEIDEHAKSRNHPDATLTAKGFTQLNNATNSTAETQAATPKAVKTVMDATNLKAPLDSPNLTGTPQAPTAPPGTNTQQLANTAFVRAAIAALINSSPGTLDTLSELAAALGNDANFATTMTNALAAKAPLASPVLTGTPMAPTAVAGTSTQQLATTAFVQAAVAELINSSPAALDTLNELAAALGNDANFATTMTNALAGKQPLDATLTALAALATGSNKLPYFTGADTVAQTDLTAVGRDLIGKGSIADMLAFLGMKTAASRDVGTGTNQIPDMSAFGSGARWFRLPNGKLIQWGMVNYGVGVNQVSVPFPVTFTGGVGSIQLTFSDINFSNGVPDLNLAVVNGSVNGAGFAAYMSGAGGFNAYYLAIGA
ncbi:phage tail protein [Buttiauxella agrestis]